MKNIILIGLPGCGKGTQSKKLSKELGYQHISTGDLIREEQSKGSAIGELATRLSDQGNFLPDDIVTTLVKQKIIDSDNKVGFVFDGYPRTVDQAKSLDEFLYNRRTPLTCIVNIVVSDMVVKDRILERAMKENRPDDKEELIPIRIQNYRNKTSAVIDYFRNRKSIIEVSGEKDENEVFVDIQNAII
jgi:adenylate kinase